MKKLLIFIPLFLFAGFLTQAQAQTGRPSTEKIWKDLSRLPQNLRDELKKSSWWKNSTAVKLDSTIKMTHFNKGKSYPLNKTTFTHPSPRVTVQSDYVNYGQWILEKRTTVTFDSENRIADVLVEEPESNTGVLQPSAQQIFFWHSHSNTQLDSVYANAWDEQWQQWTPDTRLLSFYDAQGRETASETYRFDGGFSTIGVREEYEVNAAGDVPMTRQFLAKDGKWVLLGKVTSEYDAQHHETARQEEVSVDGTKFSAVRKLRRTYDADGNLTLEERFKWNESANNWAPLKSITKGANAKARSEWAITESYKANANFKTREEKFMRPKDENLNREVQSMYNDTSKSWKTVSETRYYYSK